MLKLMMLTQDPVIASLAQSSGVDRIFYDLEYINKRERQAGRNTVLSEYNPYGIKDVRAVLDKSELVVRVNPVYSDFENEVESVISSRPDYVMLPMALSSEDVKTFIKCVGGRAKTIVMIETPQALSRIDDILGVDGIDEVFVGLNDLHIGLGLDFMFEIVAFGILDCIAAKCKERKITFGFGGIAKIGQGELPAEYIIGEHYRLGSETVILSRSFKGTRNSDETVTFDFDLDGELKKIRDREVECQSWTGSQFSENHETVKQCVKGIISKK